MSLRDRLREFTQRSYTTIEVDGIGAVRLQSITEAERCEIVSKAQNGHRDHINALLIAACVVDEENHRIYCDADLDEILSLNARISQQLAAKINDFVTPDFEEVEKNSEASQSDVSLSGSQMN